MNDLYSLKVKSLGSAHSFLENLCLSKLAYLWRRKREENWDWDIFNAFAKPCIYSCKILKNLMVKQILEKHLSRRVSLWRA